MLLLKLLSDLSNGHSHLKNTKSEITHIGNFTAKLGRIATNAHVLKFLNQALEGKTRLLENHDP